MELTIPAGIRSVHVVSASGKVIPQFITQKESTFSATDRVESEKGTLAFQKNGAIIVVKTNAVRIPASILEAIHQGLCLIAGVCNGAISWDGSGFSKTDTRIGKQLAGVWPLSTAQALIGARLVHKYRRQVGPEIAALVSSIVPPKKARKSNENAAL